MRDPHGNASAAEDIDRLCDATDLRRRALRRLAIVAELRDDATHEHTDRVAHGAGAIALALGLGRSQAELIASASALHDIGKIAIPESILLKPGSLTAAETAIMRRHAEIGAALLTSTGVPELELAEVIALGHHERWDGSGYPHGLAGAEIPLAARIAAIADVFDALVHERPYKHAWSVHDAVVEIERERGTHFDPALVDVFLELDHWRLAEAADSPSVRARRALLAAALAPAPLAA